jgi:3-oxoacyl-[acyl-carrier protein] reductase
VTTEAVAIVTGASAGIGKATALRLAADFSAIALVARDAGRLEDVARTIQGLGRRALTIEQHLGVPSSAKTVIERTLAEFGRIDALLNIAGAVPALDVFQMTDEQWEDGIAVKLHGARRLTLQAWDSLKATKGSVVFVSGTAAVVPRAAAAAVGSINAAIEALAKAFADRGIEDGIQVNSLSPGAIMTSRRLSMLEKIAGNKRVDVEEAKRAFLKQAGIARFGTAEDIAELMAFAVSPPARWMTGAVLRMDGGEVKSV